MDDLDQISAWGQDLAALRPLPPAAMERLRAIFRTDEMEAIYQSNAIEGNTLTLRETELVVAHGITIGGKPLKDHLAAASGHDPRAFQAFLVARVGATLSRYLTILGEETAGGLMTASPDPSSLVVRPRGRRPWRERLLTAGFRLARFVGARLQQPPVLPPGPCRVLVIKPCCLGDVLMTTPVLAALRARFPLAVIDYAVGRHAAPAIAGHPEVRRLVDAGPGGGRGARDLVALLRRMRAGRYDLCLVLERSPLFTVLPWLAGIPVRSGIDSDGRGFALNLRVPWDESLHEADLYLSVAAALGCPVEGHTLRFEPGPDAVARVERIWEDQGLREPVVAIAPGGGTNPGMDLPEKRWLPERFAALADRLHQDHGATIAVLGGPLDRVACEAMRAAMRGPSLDLRGRAPFAERGAFLRRCALYVGNDSGPTHLAVAVGCPVVAIFGPTDLALYGPYHARARTVHRDLACSPCFIHGYFPPCPNQHACMRGLAMADVLAACREVLGCR